MVVLLPRRLAPARAGLARAPEAATVKAPLEEQAEQEAAVTAPAAAAAVAAAAAAAAEWQRLEKVVQA